MTSITGSAPVAWIERCEMEELSEAAAVRFGVSAILYPEQGDPNHNWVPLYAAPASPAASVLSDEQILAIWRKFAETGLCSDVLGLSRALLAASMGGDKS